MTYPPRAHLPRSMVRQRSLQKGNSGSPARTSFLQVGHRKLRVRFFFTIAYLQNAGDKVVIVGLGELAATKLTFAWIVAIPEVVDIDGAVDFGGVHRGAALPEQVGLF